MTLRTVVIATRSAGKLREMRAILHERGFIAHSLDEAGVPEHSAESQLEHFDSFEANARAKAEYFARMLAGRAVIADDSGLVVDALDGQPGVRSKRWSNVAEDHPQLDAINNARLLSELERAGATRSEERTAHYVCAMSYVEAGAKSVSVDALGRCDGIILSEPRGTSGFGYDPLFWSVDLQRAFGDVSREAKAAVSHRARALRALLDAVEHAQSG